MESKHRTPSVIAKLMGFDAMSPHRSVKKRQRVLSEEYMSNVSSIGVREKRSFRLSIDEDKEIKDAFQNGACFSSNGNVVRESILGKTKNAARCFDSSSFYRNSHSNNEKKKGSIKFTRQTGHNRNSLCRKVSNSEIRVGDTSSNDSELKMVSFPNSHKKTQYRPQFNCLDMASKPHKENSDRWKTTRNSQDIKVYGRDRNVVEMLALPPHRSRLRSFTFRLGERTRKNRTGIHSDQSTRPAGSANCAHLRSSKQRHNLNVRKLEEEDFTKQSSIATNAETEVVSTPFESFKEHHFHSTDNTLLVIDDGCSSPHPDNLTQQDMTNGIYDEDSVSSFCSSTDPESLGNLEEVCHPSPNSVLEPLFEKGISCGFECFHGVNSKLHGLELQLELLKSKSLDSYSEGLEMMVSSDDDESEEGFFNRSKESNKLIKIFSTQESRDFSYLVDIFTEAGFHHRRSDISYDKWHSLDSPINPLTFEVLEKKYGEQVSWKRSERKLLFDRINSLLREILHPSIGIVSRKKPVSRRMWYRKSVDAVEEEVWTWLVGQEKQESKDSSVKVAGNDDGWLELDDEIEFIGREIEDSLIDELVTEVISFES